MHVPLRIDYFLDNASKIFLATQQYLTIFLRPRTVANKLGISPFIIGLLALRAEGAAGGAVGVGGGPSPCSPALSFFEALG